MSKNPFTGTMSMLVVFVVVFTAAVVDEAEGLGAKDIGAVEGCVGSCDVGDV